MAHALLGFPVGQSARRHHPPCVYADMQSQKTELAQPTTVVFPSRWAVQRLTYEETVAQVDNLAQILVTGSIAIAGVYMRLCDLIRSGKLPDDEVKGILSKHFSQPRVSEILRVAHAPNETYIRYATGFFGFKAALRECRGYQITPSTELKMRQARRAAARLIKLLGDATTIEIKGRLITIS